MSTSYFVTYAEPQTFVMNGTERRLLFARVTGRAHADLDDAQQELQELAACIGQPLELIQCVTFDDDERGEIPPPPCTWPSGMANWPPCGRCTPCAGTWTPTTPATMPPRLPARF